MVSDPIRVFVGCSANHEDAEMQAVLEHSLRSRASRPIEITWMRLSRDPASLFCADRYDYRDWATPFSGFRWFVPRFAGHQGRAIYVDVDFVFLADVAELAEAEMGGAAMLCDPCTGIMLIDRVGHDKTLGRERDDTGIGRLPGPWNCRDVMPADARAVHFTGLWTQPHMARAVARLAAHGWRHWNARAQRPHPVPELVTLFEAELAAAEAAGYTVASYEDEARFPIFGDYCSPRLAPMRLPILGDITC